MATKVEVAQENKWRAEDDARTLTQVQEIHDDPARLKRARKEAKKLLIKKKKEVIALERTVKKPVNSRIKRADGKEIRIRSNREYH